LLFSYCACPFAACFIYYKNYRGEKLRRLIIFIKKVRELILDWYFL
jgi:hypothetical protein